MVLVDTSIWIRSLAGKQPFRSRLDRLLGDEMVVAHELVWGELLVGDAGGRKRMLTLYEQFNFAPTVSHREVASLVTARRLSGRGIGWIDAHLLASCLVAGLRLFTADAALGVIADELGIAYAYRKT